MFVACLLVGIDTYALTSSDVLRLTRGVAHRLLQLLPRITPDPDTPGPRIQALATRVLHVCQGFQELDVSLLLLRGLPTASKGCRYVTAVALARLLRDSILPFVAAAEEEEEGEGELSAPRSESSLARTYAQARGEVAGLTQRALEAVKVESSLRLVIKKTSVGKVFDMLSMLDCCVGIAASGSDLAVPELRAPMTEFLGTINHCVTISLDPAVQRLKQLASILDSKYMHAKQSEAVQMRLMDFSTGRTATASSSSSDGLLSSLQ